MAQVLHSIWPPVCSPFVDGQVPPWLLFSMQPSHLSRELHCSNSTGLFQSGFTVPPRAWGIQWGVPSPHLWPALASVMGPPANMLIFPFQWLCYTNPLHSPPPDVQWHDDLAVTCPCGTPNLSAFLLSLGLTCESGLLGLVPKNFPDPLGQKQSFLCFAFLYSMFMTLLLSFFKRLHQIFYRTLLGASPFPSLSYGSRGWA